jgi:hypothetical protein
MAAESGAESGAAVAAVAVAPPLFRRHWDPLGGSTGCRQVLGPVRDPGEFPMLIMEIFAGSVASLSDLEPHVANRVSVAVPANLVGASAARKACVAAASEAG